MEAQGFPVINEPFVDDRRYVTQAWRQLLVYLWRQLGAGTGNSGDTILVNPGTGDNTRTLNAALADYANVNDYLNVGDTHYDGAISRALAAKNKAYFPAIPAIPHASHYYLITDTVTLNSDQALLGDGAGVSRLVSVTPNKPVVSLGENIYWFHIQGLTIAHAEGGAPAVAGGDGIFQGQGLKNWVDNCTIEDVLLYANYHGMNVGKAFRATVRDVLSSGSVGKAFRFLTTGNSDVFGVNAGGPMQWVMINCAAQASGSGGFSYNVSGAALYAVGSSVGTLQDCVTFNNQGNGVEYLGTVAHPIQSARIQGGFFGADTGAGIYLDTHGVRHVLQPQFVEASGTYNCQLTSANDQVTVQIGNCTDATRDGLLSSGAANVVITGGIYSNNGIGGGAGAGQWAGIRINGGSAQINGVLCKDGGASSSGFQNYGISVTGDDVIINGCRLTGNLVAPIYWASGPTNSIVSACLPTSINVTTLGDVRVNSLGVGVAPSGVAGRLDVAGNTFVTTLTSSVDIIANGLFHANGFAAFTAGVGITAGGMAFTSGVPGNGINVDNITINFSIGVGTGATGIAGAIDLTNYIALNGVPYINP